MAPFDSRELLERAAWARRLAFALVRDDARADDVAQELWVATLQSGPREPSALSNWMGHVLGLVAAKMRRGESRRGRREQLAARPEATEATAAIVARAQLHEMLVKHVLELEEPYCSVLLLRYFDELSPADIARARGVGVATVKTQLARGLARLRARLDARHPRGRSEWLAALAPLLATPRGSGPWIGVTLMKLKLAAWTAVVVLGLVVLWWNTRPPESTAGSSLAWDERAPQSETGGTLETTRASTLDPQAATGTTSAARASAADAAPRVDPERVLRGRVLDTAGRGIAYARVSVWSQSRVIAGEPTPLALVDAPSAELVSDAEGAFSTEAVRGHGYELLASAPGFSSRSLLSCFPGGSIEIVLSRSARLHGRVRYSDGSPARQAQLRLEPLMNFGATRLSATTRSDQDGQYEFVDAPIGGWNVAVAPLEGVESSGSVVQLTEGSVLRFDFELERGGAVEGRVYDAATGAPVAGALVTADRFDERAVRSDAEGRYRLVGVTPMSPRWFGLHARAEGYADGFAPTSELAPDALLQVDIALHRGRRVFGTVTDAHGVPLQDVRIIASARLPRRLDSRSTRSRSNGTFEITGLTKETSHTVELAALGFGRRFYDLPLSPAASDDVDLGTIAMVSAGVVMGRAVDARGEPLEGWVARIEGSNPDRVRFGETPLSGNYMLGFESQALTRRDGSFVVGDLSEGQFQFVLGLKGFAALHESQLLLGEGERRDLGEIVIDVGGTLHGVVLQSERTPVAGACVQVALASDPGQRIAYTFTDGLGRFRLGGLSEAELILKVDKGVGAQRLQPIAPGYFEHIRAGTEALELVLAPVGKIRGRVLDCEGRPARDATVDLRDERVIQDLWGLELARTDADGRFELCAGVGGSYQLTVVHEPPEQRDDEASSILELHGISVDRGELELRLPKSR